MDSWTIFKPRASRSRSKLRRQVSYDSVTENQCDGNCDFKKIIKVSRKSLAYLSTQPINMPCPSVHLSQRFSRAPRGSRAL